jgi:hypothetical protein
MDATNPEQSPTPGQPTVNDTELMSFKDLREFLRLDGIGLPSFLRANPSFPRPLILGQTKCGRDIKRFRVLDVVAYIEACPRAEH